MDNTYSDNTRTAQRNILYRIYSKAGELLYVGATTNPTLRFDSHYYTQPWWDDASNITLEHLDSWEDLCEAEMTAIVLEKPLYNVVHGVRRRRRSDDPRRAPGEGSISLRSDGIWIVSVEVRSPDGKRKQKRKSSKDRATAERHLELLLQQRAEGLL